MQEPILEYHLKHAVTGLEDIHLIGILEHPKQPLSEETEPINFFTLTKEVVAPISRQLFPEGAYKVTPLAIYRQIT